MSATALATNQPKAFPAACLLPPAAAELERDPVKAWRLQVLRVNVALLVYRLRLAQSALASAENGPRRDRDHLAAFRRYLAEVDRLMRLPAGSTEALRWKTRHSWLDGGRPKWDAAIAADAARLEGGR